MVNKRRLFVWFPFPVKGRTWGDKSAFWPKYPEHWKSRCFQSSAQFKIKQLLPILYLELFILLVQTFSSVTCYTSPSTTLETWKNSTLMLLKTIISTTFLINKAIKAVCSCYRRQIWLHTHRHRLHKPETTIDKHYCYCSCAETSQYPLHAFKNVITKSILRIQKLFSCLKSVPLPLA